ncbi:hypothetical protein B0H13DRAFT_1881159 [Mycena leptocephala]|nr:hypothetical protein B0H13DRAFT_2383850 [Mycena leptocephala]KAJ7905887.1 hypothetical protein B0H13DRAFT_1881159 [Mycena leptocephala]
MPSSNESILPLFSSAPRPAPVPPTRSNASSNSGSTRSSPDGFVVPCIPPLDCPLRVILDPQGRPQLPHVSDHPLPVDHERVLRLMKSRTDVNAKCAHCAEAAIECDWSEAGVPCAPCAVLGIPDCDFADPYFLVQNLAHQRNLYLHSERAILCAAVRDNHLSPSQFDREYERASSWFYSAAQGAITRFLVNSYATCGLALRGYQLLAASSTDAGLLSRFLTLGHDSDIHPSVLKVVADRLRSLYTTLLGE